MSIHAISWAFQQKIKDPLAKLVLLVVADHYNDSTKDAWPSVDRIVEITGGSRSTVIRKLKMLEEMGLMQRTKRYNKTDLYKLNLGGCLSDTCHSDTFEVSHRHTIHYEPLINKKKKDRKQKVSEWIPSNDDIKYAHDLGLDAEDVIERIRLWDEQNGNTAAYVSVSAFFKNWCKREAKKPKAAEGKPKEVTAKQKAFIESLILKYKRAYPYDDPAMIAEALNEMMSKGLDLEGWHKLGYGLKHYTEF